MIKYRHSFHAGNFADVHKHVTLVALLQALERKAKGFLYLDTHAGRGLYALEKAAEGRASAPGIERVLTAAETHPELAAYVQTIAVWRSQSANARAYPGSPLIAASRLRSQDRAVLIELNPEEAGVLERTLEGQARTQVLVADGFERLRAHLPPPERRGIMLIDPPYEEQGELARIDAAVVEALRRFQTGVIAVWYPIKDARDIAAWHVSLRRSVAREILISELWIHPCDSQVGLNGSGILVINPPYGIAERMQAWLPALHMQLDADRSGGTSVRML